VQGATKFVVLRIIPLQDRSNKLAANGFSEFITTTINHRELCACVFHAGSLTRQISKTQRGHVPRRGLCPFFSKETQMGLLFDMAAFYRWLQEASDDELSGRRAEALKMEAELSDEDVKRRLRRLVGMIEEEMVARKFRV